MLNQNKSLEGHTVQLIKKNISNDVMIHVCYKWCTVTVPHCVKAPFESFSLSLQPFRLGHLLETAINYITF